MLSALKETFRSTAFGKTAMAAAIAVPVALASIGPAANDAYAGEAQAAVLQTPVQMRDAMDDYSENLETRGVGVFINLRQESSVTGEQIGEWIRGQFSGVNVPVEYRVNQSRGTATDVTLYVRGVSFTVSAPDLPNELPEIYEHYQGAWLPETAALDTQPQ